MKKVVVLLLGAILVYMWFMKPWDCVKNRVDVGIEGNIDTWIDCSY